MLPIKVNNLVHSSRISTIYKQINRELVDFHARRIFFLLFITIHTHTHAYIETKNEQIHGTKEKNNLKHVDK